MLSPSDVTAVLVTRGDIDLTPVLESLIFPEVIVWDNSIEHHDEKTYGRVAATLRATNSILYSQDDDIIHTPENQMQILAAYQPGVLVGCMWEEWSTGAKTQGIEGGYDDLVFAGAGSVYDYDIPWMACAQYLDQYPRDDFFLLWADTIIGVIADTKQLDIRFEILPCAEDENRMCNLPDGIELKTEAIRRARGVREPAVAA